jgi:hypothetical protein
MAMPIMPNSSTPSVAAIAMTRTTIRNVCMPLYTDHPAPCPATPGAIFIDKPGSRMIRLAS